MRRLPVLVIALGAVLAPVLGLPVAAHAGGPTSVLVTRPGHDAAALYYTDGRYADLERLVAAEAEAVPAPAGLDGGGQTFNLTWLIHDQLIWRTDRVHVDGRQVYLETTMVGGVMVSGVAETTTWHRVESGKQLLGLLHDLLKGGSRGGGGADVYAPDLVASSSTPPAQSAEPPAPEPRGFAVTGWVWALPGLVLGAVGALLAGRWRRSRSPEPRQVLIDREPVGA